MSSGEKCLEKRVQILSKQIFKWPILLKGGIINPINNLRHHTKNIHI